MIISRTPFRVSLFGGGTDYPQWFREHGGAVIGTAIDKYCYISVRDLPPFFEHSHRIVYSKIENVKTIDEIQHPAARAVMKEMKVSRGLEIHHDGDLPARAGLGSSSSFTVGLIAALQALGGRMSSKKELAQEAIRIEQEVIAENVGCQDQIWAAYGGMNRIDFSTDGSFSVRPIISSPERTAALTSSMVLYFTGLSRNASDIAGRQIENMKARQATLRIMRAMVDEAEAILTDPKQDLREIGELLHESWMLKRGLAEGVTTGLVDEIYQAGREAGAIGGKLLGAGGGGFILFFVEKHNQPTLRERLKDLIEVSFMVDRAGSTIVVYEPNGLGTL
jgi:D-glycero-alpha-D-manno-heptose-7-phosphate kinase